MVQGSEDLSFLVMHSVVVEFTGRRLATTLLAADDPPAADPPAEVADRDRASGEFARPQQLTVFSVDDGWLATSLLGSADAGPPPRRLPASYVLVASPLGDEPDPGPPPSGERGPRLAAQRLPVSLKAYESRAALCDWLSRVPATQRQLAQSLQTQLEANDAPPAVGQRRG